MINVQMAIRTGGQQLYVIEPEAMDALNASAAKCASTIHWPQKLLGWQPVGTLQQIKAHLMMS